MSTLEAEIGYRSKHSTLPKAILGPLLPPSGCRALLRVEEDVSPS